MLVRTVNDFDSTKFQEEVLPKLVEKLGGKLKIGNVENFLVLQGVRSTGEEDKEEVLGLRLQGSDRLPKSYRKKSLVPGFSESSVCEPLKWKELSHPLFRFASEELQAAQDLTGEPYSVPSKEEAKELALMYRKARSNPSSVTQTEPEDASPFKRMELSEQTLYEIVVVVDNNSTTNMEGKDTTPGPSTPHSLQIVVERCGDGRFEFDMATKYKTIVQSNSTEETTSFAQQTNLYMSAVAKDSPVALKSMSRQLQASLDNEELTEVAKDNESSESVRDSEESSPAIVGESSSKGNARLSFILPHNFKSGIRPEVKLSHGLELKFVQGIPLDKLRRFPTYKDDEKTPLKSEDMAVSLKGNALPDSKRQLISNFIGTHSSNSKSSPSIAFFPGVISVDSGATGSESEWTTKKGKHSTRGKFQIRWPRAGVTRRPEADPRIMKFIQLNCEINGRELMFIYNKYSGVEGFLVRTERSGSRDIEILRPNSLLDLRIASKESTGMSPLGTVFPNTRDQETILAMVTYFCQRLEDVQERNPAEANNLVFEPKFYNSSAGKVERAVHSSGKAFSIASSWRWYRKYEEPLALRLASTATPLGARDREVLSQWRLRTNTASFGVTWQLLYAHGVPEHKSAVSNNMTFHSGNSDEMLSIIDSALKVLNLVDPPRPTSEVLNPSASLKHVAATLEEKSTDNNTKSVKKKRNKEKLAIERIVSDAVSASSVSAQSIPKNMGVAASSTDKPATLPPIVTPLSSTPLPEHPSAEGGTTRIPVQYRTLLDFLHFHNIIGETGKRSERHLQQKFHIETVADLYSYTAVAGGAARLIAEIPVLASRLFNPHNKVNPLKFHSSQTLMAASSNVVIGGSGFPQITPPTSPPSTAVVIAPLEISSVVNPRLLVGDYHMGKATTTLLPWDRSEPTVLLQYDNVGDLHRFASNHHSAGGSSGSRDLYFVEDQGFCVMPLSSYSKQRGLQGVGIFGSPMSLKQGFYDPSFPPSHFVLDETELIRVHQTSNSPAADLPIQERRVPQFTSHRFGSRPEQTFGTSSLFCMGLFAGFLSHRGGFLANGHQAAAPKLMPEFSALKKFIARRF